MKLAPDADRIAKKVMAYVDKGEPVPTWHVIRDDVDMNTYGDLCPSLLDRLTDMVERRVLRHAAKN